MSASRISGIFTLVVTLAVVVIGVACMIWSRVGIAKLEIFSEKDINKLNSCLVEAGRASRGNTPFLCDPNQPFVCDTTENDASIPYTICGIPPSCLCFASPAVNQYMQMLHATSISGLIQILLNITGWLNFAAGASAIVGVLPVLIGAVGKVAGNTELAVACGVTGIVFEVCCGLLTTWVFAGVAYFIAQVGYAFGYAIWQETLTFTNTSTQVIPNYCPEVCVSATTDIKNEWQEFAQNVSTASSMAFLAAGVSIVALVCTCIGFCIQRNAAPAATYAPKTTTTTTTTIAQVQQPLMTANTVTYQTAAPVAVPTVTAVYTQ